MVAIREMDPKVFFLIPDVVGEENIPLQQIERREMVIFKHTPWSILEDSEITQISESSAVLNFLSCTMRNHLYADYLTS